MTPKKKWKYRILCITTVLFYGCSGMGSDDPSWSSNAVLNSLLESAPVGTVHLDSVTVDSVYLDKTNRLGEFSERSFETPVPAGRLVSVIMVDDHLLVADRQANQIRVINSDGVLVELLGREGSGPGEFLGLSGLYANENYIFAVDRGNARIAILNHQYETVSFINLPPLSLGLTGSITVTDSLLFIPFTDLGGYYRNHLIQTYQAYPYFQEVGTILERLIPAPQPAGPFNSYLISGNRQGEFLIGFRSFPYLFLFDRNARHQQTILIDSEHYVQPDLDEAGEFQFRNPHLFLGSVYISEGGALFLGSGRNLYRLESSGEGWNLTGAWHFAHHDPEMREEYGIPVESMVVDSDVLYFTNMWEESLFRFPLQE